MGANGLVFDPSIDWFSKTVAVGSGGAAGAGYYVLSGE